MIRILHNNQLKTIKECYVNIAGTIVPLMSVYAHKDGKNVLVWENWIDEVVIIPEGTFVNRLDMITLFDRIHRKGRFKLINNGTIYNDTPDAYSITIKGFHKQSIITLENNGYIVGMGGRGGNGYVYTEQGASNGSHAVLIERPVNIINNGTIGGGGGGGQGALARASWSSFPTNGGGGAGYPAGVCGNSTPERTATNLINATNGTLLEGGVGQYAMKRGLGSGEKDHYVRAGGGGALGVNGGSGTSSPWNQSYSIVGGNIGIAGIAIKDAYGKNSTLTNNGVLAGASDL